jgi:site-specific recombinase XerD
MDHSSSPGCLSERGPMTRQAVNYLVAEIGKRAKLRFHVHPYMLRHSTGYYLANRGYDTRLVQDYLGHENIAHTVRYTRTAAIRFERLGVEKSVVFCPPAKQTPTSPSRLN